MRIESGVEAAAAGYSESRATKAPEWHSLVAWDMLFNNLSIGLFLAAAGGEWVAPATFARVARIAYPVALMLLAADLLCLVLDLGDPRRFHHMLRVFKPTSPMSLGTWSLTAFSLPLTVAAVISFFPDPGRMLEMVRGTAIVVAVVPAVMAAVYKGVLFSITAQPGWRDARWLGGYLANSALMLGCALLLALAVLSGEERAMSVLRGALGLTLLLNILPLGLLLGEVAPTVRRTCSIGRQAGIASAFLVGGVLAPLALLIWGEPGGSMVAVPCIVAASALVRFEIVWLPHRTSWGQHGQIGMAHDLGDG